MSEQIWGRDGVDSHPCIRVEAYTRAVDDLRAVTARAEAAEAKIARVEAVVEAEARIKSAHHLESDCGCSYKDCYECGKWCRCIHTPYHDLSAALADEGDTDE